MSIFDKFFGNRKENTIEIAHGKERYIIDFDQGTIEDGRATVGDLRLQCTYITKVPIANIKLLFRGKTLADDKVPLVAVGMRSGSKVLCMASQTVPKVNPVTRPQKAVLQPVEQLDALLLQIKTDLAPQVHEYTTRNQEERIRKETHDRLAELLLQKLFALDGIVSRVDAPDAEKDILRTKRKEAVRYTQDLLDSVDKVMNDDTRAAELAEHGE